MNEKIRLVTKRVIAHHLSRQTNSSKDKFIIFARPCKTLQRSWSLYSGDVTAVLPWASRASRIVLLVSSANITCGCRQYHKPLAGGGPSKNNKLVVEGDEHILLEISQLKLSSWSCSGEIFLVQSQRFGQGTVFEAK
ncbi:hypothetical protein RRG08_048532 [Elysia crispata]|uniref:Uncharacterized protein n=1 Tax=Elysia crispata TaxID=231223 RepID=A0AAE1B536_9GAST|nr:hypothetical protein RRG08_048532 [Elysia crispata]